MSCQHEKFRCTNGEFFCLVCGARIENPYEAKEEPKKEPKEEPKEEPEKKPARKRKGESK